jgi:multidrug efflux pump subunit AcrB
MSQEISYIERLKFDAKLNFGLVASYLKNFRLAILLILVIFIGGIVSYFNIPQRLNPEIKIPIVSISTILPGASPQDVESLVTIPIEDQISSVIGVDTLTSSSTENVSIISVQFISGVDPKAAEQEIKAAVDKVTSLPEDATDPSVKAFDFEDQPIWTFAVSSDQEIPSLMRFSDKLKAAIDKSGKVDRVVTSGFEEREVQVVIDPQKIRQYNFNAQQLIQTIRTATKSFPAGTLDTGKNIVSLTINPQIATIQDIRNTRITVQGQTVRLSDIAEISERPKDNQAKSFLADNNKAAQRVVTFFVYKTTGSDINKTSDEVKKIVEDTVKESDNKFQITTVLNTSDEIRKQFNDLLGEFSTTVVLVFICLLLFVGLRQAIISSITVPLTFLSAFLLMPLFGMSINFLTLFAFLIALGLLIDDTIVIVSAMTTYYRTEKFSTFETGALVWRDYIVPIWSTTITTICAFVPLLLASGIIGEFIKPIPVVIALVMISSTAIAVLITLPLMMIVLKPQIPARVLTLLKILFFIGAVGIIITLAPQSPLLPLVVISYFVVLYILIKIKGPIRNSATQLVQKNNLVHRVINRIKLHLDQPVLHLDPIAEKYKNFIRRILQSKSARRKTLAAVIIFALVSYALVPLGFVKNEFFPKTDAETLYINLEYPSGSNLVTTTSEAMTILDIVRQESGVKYVQADIGRSTSLSMGGSGGGSNSVALTLHLTEDSKDIGSLELTDKLTEKLKTYTKAKVSVLQESNGPPAGSDLQIELSGDDLATVDSFANKIMEYLGQQKGVNNVTKSLKPGPSQIVFVPNPEEMAKYNITTDQIGFNMRLFASGVELESIKFKDGKNEEEKIILKLGYGNKSPDELGKILIPSGNTSIPLSALGRLETQASPTQISRNDRKRTITVSAGIQPGQANTTEEGQKLEKFADTLSLPDGYAWQTGGVNEENEKSVQSIIQAMGVAIVLILLTMVIQFGSFRQAFIALAVIPLAVSSVFFVFALTGTPLSFPALIGVLALFGIIVTNSMFVIDKINLNRKQGMTFLESVADAGSSRLEPIVLTKLCTILGLLPITLSEPLWRGLGGAIISGVLLGSSFMLLFIPVVYYTFFAKEEEAKDALKENI